MLEHGIQHQHMDICFSNNEANTNTQHTFPTHNRLLKQKFGFKDHFFVLKGFSNVFPNLINFGVGFIVFRATLELLGRFNRQINSQTMNPSYKKYLNHHLITKSIHIIHNSSPSLHDQKYHQIFT